MGEAAGEGEGGTVLVGGCLGRLGPVGQNKREGAQGGKKTHKEGGRWEAALVGWVPSVTTK